jgi:hypothetical protein
MQVRRSRNWFMAEIEGLTEMENKIEIEMNLTLLLETWTKRFPFMELHVENKRNLVKMR